MIKQIVKKILSLGIKKFRSPSKPGFIKIFDSVAGKDFFIFWRKDSFMETEFFRYGLYGGWEKCSLTIWAQLAKQSNCILDIGANTGIYSLIAFNNNPKAKIIAIEPVQLNYELLQQNISKNNYTIIAEKIALSDYDGEAKMFAMKDRLNYMTALNDNRYAIHPEMAINSEVIEITVDVKPYNFLKERYDLKNVDLIKIDVEGHELAVIKTLLPQIELSRPVILIEIISDETAQAINQLLKNFDYYFFSIDEETGSIKKVERLWNNDHQNFLICDEKTIKLLSESGLYKN
jgi:FkbM family methyltransferase